MARMATLLAGLSTLTAGVINTADSVLSALGKLQASLTGLTIVVGTKLDKGTYTGTASTLEALANSKETPLAAQAKANAAEADAKAYAEALLAGSGGSTNTTKIISFSPNWQSGLIFNPNGQWMDGGVLYGETREIIADAADATYGRFDKFIIDLTLDQITLLKGTPSVNPVVPELTDPLTQLDTGVFISIPAGAATPEGVSGETIYDGESTGWTVAENAKWNTQRDRKSVV